MAGTAQRQATIADDWAIEIEEWLAALEDVVDARGEGRARELIERLYEAASRHGLVLPDAALNTPYRNTISWREQPEYPGDLALETRIGNIIRWNAVAMVLKAFDSGSGVGGHIATYLSAAAMMEVGFNHVFRAPAQGFGGDQVHFQAHAAPGVYARAFLEGRLSAEQLDNFRRELAPGGGLSSYPHPRRMPDFWQMPTASMGLSTPSAIYQARFAKYLEGRGLKRTDGAKVWVFIGDGESDEPEVLGTINMASREHLDNLVLVINCNLQRLDGPVRGNGKIIQELERSFRGADWHVIKVIWGGGWDALLDRDVDGILQRRMEQAVDGDYQMYTVSPGDAVREHWVEDTPALKELMKTLSNEEIRSIKRGGQDPQKIYAAFKQAAEIRGKPCVVLLKTVKGDGLGPKAEGRNTVHQKKQLSVAERRELARRFDIPLSDDAVARADFYLPAADSPEREYLMARRQALGGFLPMRRAQCARLQAPELALFADMLAGSGEREVSTTMAVVRMLSKLVRDPNIGRYVVPIVPDEARTFGMDGLLAQAGIYSPEGQRYRPVDAGTIAPYREAADGQVLQEGICETGAMASFLAAGTAYANHGLPMIPFYIFYSMFGMQRVGDMVWACGDSLAKGFLIGGTSGRTTLNGEGVQHQDGHSHVLASTVPNLTSYDPAFAYEIAVIVREGIRRMYDAQEDVFYYLTVTNQNYPMPAMPADADGAIADGIIRGAYCYRRGTGKVPPQGTPKGSPQGSPKGSPQGSPDDTPIHLLGSGAIMTEVLRAAETLGSMGKAVTVWSVTSYTELCRDAQDAERERLLGRKRTSWLERLMGDERGVFVAASDYMKSLPQSIGRWLPGKLTVLGTDGFGLSESREVLRDHFEVSAPWIVYAALVSVGQPKAAREFAMEAKIDLDRANPRG